MDKVYRLPGQQKEKAVGVGLFLSPKVCNSSDRRIGEMI